MKKLILVVVSLIILAGCGRDTVQSSQERSPDVVRYFGSARAESPVFVGSSDVDI